LTDLPGAAVRFAAVEAGERVGVNEQHGPATGRRILIVSAAMGGGHLQISRELQRRLGERGHDVLVADMLDLMPPPTGRWLGRLYPWLVNRVPWLYDRIYQVFFLARQRAGERAGVPVRLAVPGLRRLVARFRPDVVVSTYHLAALAVGRLRASGDLPAPAITVITQFAVNDLWLHPATDLELAISEQAAAEATARSGRQAQVCGPVVRPVFTSGRRGADERGDEQADEQHVERKRAELGVPPGSRAALVVTGSSGLTGDAEQAVAAICAHPGWVPVVVCGRSGALRRRLERSGAAAGGAVLLGWVQDMAELMSACDVLVDNAGGMCSKEALGIGLPVVTFRPIAGHGRDDAAALARLGLTDVVDDPGGLPAVLDRLADPRLHADRAERGRALFVADAAAIVENVAAVAGSGTAGGPG
jgi:UDP-N-acetylglucosamine:LPS N-acetylglucosamine transferase